MATLQHDLKLVLEVEREGQRRLAEARAESQDLIERHRQEARRLLEEGERALARHREQRTAEVDGEIAAAVDELERRYRAEEGRLHGLAERNRDAAATQVLNWLWGED